MMRVMRRVCVAATIAFGSMLGTGCASLEAALAGLDKPTARVVGADLKGLSIDGVSIDFDVEVKNPYRVPLPVGSLDYSLASDGRQFLSGASQSQGSIPARGIKTLKAPVTVRFGDLLGALQTVRPGKVIPYTADLRLGLDAPNELGGPIVVPIRKEGSLPIPAPPELELREIAWEEMSLSSAKGKLVLGVTNLNEFEAALTRLDYALSLGGTTVAKAKVSALPKLGAGESGEITLPISIKPMDLGLAAFNMLQGSDTSYSLKGAMGVKTPFGSLDVPVDKSGASRMTR